jgi:hypothetical protein
LTPEAVSIILECLDRVRSLTAALEDAGAEPEGDDAERERRGVTREHGAAIVRNAHLAQQVEPDTRDPELERAGCEAENGADHGARIDDAKRRRKRASSPAVRPSGATAGSSLRRPSREAGAPSVATAARAAVAEPRRLDRSPGVEHGDDMDAEPDVPALRFALRRRSYLVRLWALVKP